MKSLNNIQMSTLTEQDLNYVNGGTSSVPVIFPPAGLGLVIKIIQWLFK